MFEVEFLPNEDGTARSSRLNGTVYASGEKAGFDEETAKHLVAKGAAKILRQSVPDTAGVGADMLEAECPHCKKPVLILTGGPKQGRLVEFATDGKGQVGRGPRAEQRSN